MSEPLFKGDNNSSDDVDDDDAGSSKHDGFDIFGSLFKKLNIWTALLLFVLFIVLNTNFFLEDVMKKINANWVSNDSNPTSTGIIVQGIFLSIGYIIIDLLVSSDII
jgi:hypothetical protein